MHAINAFCTISLIYLTDTSIPMSSLKMNKLWLRLDKIKKNPFPAQAMQKYPFLFFPVTSVTRFGEISPLWKQFTSRLGIFWRFISYLAKIRAYFGNFLTLLGLIFIIANGQILKNNLTIWSHCFFLSIFVFFNLGNMHQLKFWNSNPQRISLSDDSIPILFYVCSLTRLGYFLKAFVTAHWK